MLRGFYTAASGMVTHENRLNVYANNLANVSTVGFKKDNLVVGTFGEHMAVRMNSYEGQNREGIGRGVFITTTVDDYTDFQQGAFESTGRPIDMALQGNGFFLIRDDDGNEWLTRDGQFALDDEGYLVLPGYGRVQGEGGDIQPETSAFTVAGDGTIYLNPDPEEDDDFEAEEIDRLLIVVPNGDAEVRKVQDQELFATDAWVQVEYNDEEEGVLVRQGSLERSNVNVAEEMSNIIATQRGLQTCSQILKMYDEMAEQASSRLTRI